MGKGNTISKHWTPDQPLENNRWEDFAQDCFLGKMTVTDVYRKHYPNCKCKPQLVYEKACKLRTKLEPRIAWLKQQVANKNIVTRETFLADLWEMSQFTIADYLSIDQDGQLFVKVTKEVLACKAIKAVKFRSITDENGNVVLGIHLTDITMVDPIQLRRLIADVCGFHAPKQHELTGKDGDPLQAGLLCYPAGTKPEVAGEEQD